MDFIGRAKELEKLEQEFAQSNQTVALVYGRRRVGKSELIKQSLKKTSTTRAIYYECKQTTEMNNAESLSALASETLGLPPMAHNGIEPLLDFLFAQSLEQGIVLVLDEYPYLRQTVKGLDSILQSLIDKYQNTSQMHLVLCGSYVEAMKSLLGHSNPLFGRVDVTISLKPMDYYDSAKFYPEFSPEDKVRLYSVFGGIPYYNRLIKQDKSVRQNIIDLIASPGSRLENEVPMYITSEISKLSNANEVFGALSAGYSQYRDLLDQSHVSSGPAMVDVLKKLIDMELVQKQAPINDPNNKKKSGYHIVDPLSLFYFKYLFKNLSQMAFLDPDVFYDRYIDKNFEEDFVPHMFEEVCRQYLIRQNKAGKIDEPFDVIGRYWYDDPETHTNGEFDIVTRDPKGYVFYEAKFRKSPIDQKMVNEEIAQVEKTGLQCYKYGFFSRSGFTANAGENTVFVDLEDLFK